jgi:HAD superfamily hydrolase (TIGR01509 family)
MFRGMIFDLDGVVADTHPIHKEAWRQLLAEAGRHVSAEHLDFVCEGRRRADILHHFLGPLSAEAIQHYGKRKDELFFGSTLELRATAGVHGFLSELDRAGMPKALATSAGWRRTDHVLARLGLSGCFYPVVTGDDVVNAKPNPEIFLIVAQQLGLAPMHLLVIEDSRAGVRAAKAAGMKCLGIASGAHATTLRREGADCVSADFRGLTVAQLAKLLTVGQQSPTPATTGVPAA